MALPLSGYSRGNLHKGLLPKYRYVKRQAHFVTHSILCLVPSDTLSGGKNVKNGLERNPFYGFFEMTAIRSSLHVKQQMELRAPHGREDVCSDFFSGGLQCISYGDTGSLMEFDALARHCSRLHSAQIAPVGDVHLDGSFNEAGRGNSIFCLSSVQPA